MLSQQVFEKSVLLILTSFPNRKIEPVVYYELLKDLDDESFLKATVELCKDHVELYPDTNLVALLRNKYMEIKKRPQEFLKIEQERFTAGPTKEFRELIEKLAKEKPVKGGKK